MTEADVPCPICSNPLGEVDDGTYSPIYFVRHPGRTVTHYCNRCGWEVNLKQKVSNSKGKTVATGRMTEEELQRCESAAWMLGEGFAHILKELRSERERYNELLERAGQLGTATSRERSLIMWDQEDFELRLRDITEGCRPDMHEPDEQELTARVVGSHLDNAMGDRVEPELVEEGAQEFVVILERGDEGSGDAARSESFNLASLIALARRQM